jgi:SAM-dependent methyltransferase
MSDREYLATLYRALGRRAPGGDALARRIGALCDVRRGDRVLDLGAGRGGTARLLAREFGCEVTCVEEDEAAVAALESAARESGLEVLLHARRADLAAADFPEASFDVVLAEGSLGAMGPSVEEAARALRVLLKTNGRLAASVTARVGRTLPAAVEAFFADELAEPLLWPGDLAAAFERAGYEPLTAECLPEADLEEHFHELERALPKVEGSPAAEKLARSIEVFRREGGRSACAAVLLVTRRKEAAERPPLARGGA